jgi:hypothetical protein
MLAASNEWRQRLLSLRNDLRIVRGMTDELAIKEKLIEQRPADLQLLVDVATMESDLANINLAIAKATVKFAYAT